MVGEQAQDESVGDRAGRLISDLDRDVADARSGWKKARRARHEAEKHRRSDVRAARAPGWWLRPVGVGLSLGLTLFGVFALAMGAWSIVQAGLLDPPRFISVVSMLGIAIVARAIVGMVPPSAQRARWSSAAVLILSLAACALSFVFEVPVAIWVWVTYTALVLAPVIADLCAVTADAIMRSHARRAAHRNRAPLAGVVVEHARERAGTSEARASSIRTDGDIVAESSGHASAVRTLSDDPMPHEDGASQPDGVLANETPEEVALPDAPMPLGAVRHVGAGAPVSTLAVAASPLRSLDTVAVPDDVQGLLDASRDAGIVGRGTLRVAFRSV